MPRDLEIAELIADVKEHVLYLRELGVDGLNVEMPEVSARFVGRVEQGRPEPEPSRQSVSVKDTGIPSSFSNEGSFAAAPESASNARAGKVPSQRKAPGTDVPAGRRLAALPSLKNRKAAEQISVGRTGGEATPSATDVSAAKETAEVSMFGEKGEAVSQPDETVADIRDDIGNCTRCPLSEGRTQIVHTTGNFNADLMFIGEAPGADEDLRGEPFVGRAGQLLNKIIEAIGMTREEVAIGNINRCRPPANRAPTLPEAHTCRPFLLREIAVIKPKVIVVMGNTALHNLLDTKDGITKVRGRFQDYFGVKVMPTFHPAYLLRDPHKKRDTWEDMKMVRDYLNSTSQNPER